MHGFIVGHLSLRTLYFAGITSYTVLRPTGPFGARGHWAEVVGDEGPLLMIVIISYVAR